MLDILACPICKHHPLEEFDINVKDELVHEGALFCAECSRYFPITEEIPIMLPDELRDKKQDIEFLEKYACLLYTSPSPRDGLLSRMPSSA